MGRIPQANFRRTIHTQPASAVIDMVQDWVKVYCDTAAEADKLRTNLRFSIPILLRCFKSMLKEKSKTRIAIEFVCKDTSKSTFVSVAIDEVEPHLDKFIDFYSSKEDYEECKEILDMKREFTELEITRE